MAKFFAHGKLLLTAEYMVVKGAQALALPTRKGQHLEVKDGSGSELVWKSLDDKGEEWFNAKYDLMGFDCLKTSDEEKAEHLRKILRAVCRDNSDFLSKWKKYRVTTSLDFPLDAGLGSSSTLIHLLCEWAEANPYLVYFNMFNGSGYDIACASADGPILYQFKGDSLDINPIDWSPECIDQMYLVHLGKKQDSPAAVEGFLKKRIKKSEINESSDLTQAFVKASSLRDLEKVIDAHEVFMGSILGQTPIQNERFSDFDGKVKSLGAWGGDMALVTSSQEKKKVAEYFKGKGLNRFFSFKEEVLM